VALHRLPRVVPAPPGRPALADEHHPIRHVTRRIAFGGTDAWSAERRANVAALFDGLAAEWDTNPGRRLDAVTDAFDRGGPFPPGPCLEVGSGTGIATGLVAQRRAPVVAVDLSAGMLALSTAPVPHVRADASALPVAGGSVAVVVLVNMFLFPAEVARVLGPDGVLVWVNTLGDATPIHLPADEVVAALPGRWRGVTADAGWGTWTAVRRRILDEPTGS
jgi:SAM-dependent methyltransferase